jgi:hypothetical protein
MKNIKLYVILFIPLGFLSQCKKGEDDPFISLRSRKARVVGEWHLTSGNSTSTNSSGSFGSTTIYNYTESSFTENYTSGAVNTTTSGVYSLKMTFERNGDFSMTETKGTDVSSLKGVWNFTGKIGEYKNKEQIVIKLTSYTSTDPNSSYTGNFTGKDIDAAFTIKELRNKKMVLIQESTSFSTNNSNTYKQETVLEQ